MQSRQTFQRLSDPCQANAHGIIDQSLCSNDPLTSGHEYRPWILETLEKQTNPRPARQTKHVYMRLGTAFAMEMSSIISHTFQGYYA